MATFETESGKQIEIPETWSNLVELLKSGDLSEQEKRKLQFAWYMNSQLPEKAEANGESTNG